MSRTVWKVFLCAQVFKFLKIVPYLLRQESSKGQNTTNQTWESLMMMMMMMMMKNCFCGMVDKRKAFSLISSQDHCQRSSSSRISNASRAGYRITIFDLTQLWIIGLTEQCSIWNFSSMFSLFFHTFRQVLKFSKKTKYWSLKETGTSYK